MFCLALQLTMLHPVHSSQVNAISSAYVTKELSTAFLAFLNSLKSWLKKKKERKERAKKRTSREKTEDDVFGDESLHANLFS